MSEKAKEELHSAPIEEPSIKKLEDFSLIQLLELLNLAQQTGRLLAKTAAQTVTLYVRAGALISAHTDATAEHLTAILVKMGKLPGDHAETINSRLGTPPDRVTGKYLMDAGLVSRDDIIQGVRDYMLEIVYDLSTWTEAEFYFEPDALPARDRITVPLKLDNVMLEIRRIIQEHARLLDELPDLGAIALKITDKPMRDVKITQDDWRVISHIHPRNSVKQIAQNNGMGEFRIRKIVSAMLEAGLVEVIPHEPSDYLEARSQSDRQSTGSEERAKKKKNGGETGGNSGSGGLPDLVSIRRQQPGDRPPALN